MWFNANHFKVVLVVSSEPLKIDIYTLWQIVQALWLSEACTKIKTIVFIVVLFYDEKISKPKYHQIRNYLTSVISVEYFADKLFNIDITIWEM